MGVRVEPIRAGVSSRMAFLAAVAGDSPSERWRTMFSTMTMASSMTTPTAAARPPRVMRLKLMWKSFRNTIVMRIVAGITRAATRVVRQRFKKPTSTATERPRPIRMLSVTLAMESRTRSDWS